MAPIAEVSIARVPTRSTATRGSKQVRNHLYSSILKFTSSLVPLSKAILIIERAHVPAFQNGCKVATRRVVGEQAGAWGDRIYKQHLQAYKNKSEVRVWCGYGDKYTVGWIQYTHMFKQQLRSMSTLDVALEGCAGMSRKEFRQRYFVGVPLLAEVYVLCFKLIAIA